MVFEVKADMRARTASPVTTLSISIGRTWASTTRASPRGTMSIIGSPGGITPPMVLKARLSTWPDCGAIISVRVKTSSSAINSSRRLSASSCASIRSDATLSLKLRSTWRISISASPMATCARATSALIRPISPVRRASSRSRAKRLRTSISCSSESWL